MPGPSLISHKRTVDDTSFTRQPRCDAILQMWVKVAHDREIIRNRGDQGLESLKVYPVANRLTIHVKPVFLVWRERIKVPGTIFIIREVNILCQICKYWKRAEVNWRNLFTLKSPAITILWPRDSGRCSGGDIFEEWKRTPWIPPNRWVSVLGLSKEDY